MESQRKTPQGAPSPYRYTYRTGEQCEEGDVVEYGNARYVVKSGNGGSNHNNPQVKLIGTTTSPTVGKLRLVSRRQPHHPTHFEPAPPPRAQMYLFPPSPASTQPTAPDGSNEPSVKPGNGLVDFFFLLFFSNSHQVVSPRTPRDPERPEESLDDDEVSEDVHLNNLRQALDDEGRVDGWLTLLAQWEITTVAELLALEDSVFATMIAHDDFLRKSSLKSKLLRLRIGN